jgi:hypothetical protein
MINRVRDYESYERSQNSKLKTRLLVEHLNELARLTNLARHVR